jgi:putative OPT family oligopeptide transporter
VVGAYRAAGAGQHVERTERDLNPAAIVALLVPTILAVLLLYTTLSGSARIGLVAGGAMLVAAFFFVAVSSYIVGLVGASNNPVSGMTISTVLFAALLLLVLGLTGSQGVLASLVVAGVVCCAACTAGDVSQDLKTGHLVGASPYKQQWAQVIGVVVPAAVIAPVLGVLHSAYGIGVPAHEGVEYLKAPQANLFASITQAMFGTGAAMPWRMIVAGMATGVGLIVLDAVLKRAGSPFRTYVMPVAVGIYLPWSLGVPIFLGGLAAWITARAAGPSRATAAVHRGVLVGSGLIAGEALMGILIALLIVFAVRLPQIELPDAAEQSLSVAMLLLLIAGMILVALKRRDRPLA